MRKISIILCAIIVFMLISAHPVLAQRNWIDGGGYFPGLNLAPDQIEEIQELRLRFQEETLSLRTELQALSLKLRTMYYKGADQDDVYARQTEINELQEEMGMRYMEHQKEIRYLLTDEQKLLFDRWSGAGPGYVFGDRMIPGVAGGRGWGAGNGRGWNTGYDQSWVQGMAPGTGLTRGSNLNMGRGWRCPGLWNRW
ncbi:MAG: hypothetical protein ABIJ42_04345, partial [Acidobacteriota bacterium]